MVAKKIYTVLFTVFCTCGLPAQSYSQTVRVDNIEVRCADKEVTVKFVLQAGQKIVKSDYSLIITPVVKSREDSIALPEIVIQGNRARLIEERQLLATGRKKKNSLYYIKNGGSVLYAVTIPYQDWMRQAEIALHGMLTGCCSVREVTIGVIVPEIYPGFQVMQPADEDPVVIPKKLTTGDKLSVLFPFLAPAGELGQYETGSFINENKKNALTIYFEQGKRVIDQAYKNNQEALVKLISTVRAIESSSDCRVSRIIIAGFASPEGSLAFNDRLAWDRALALQRFVADHTALSLHQVYLYNGSVDWAGLRERVQASEMRDKSRILEIIDAPQWERDNRLNRIMNLNGGGPYHYLLTNFFPLLRNAAYVKVFYENF